MTRNTTIPQHRLQVIKEIDERRASDDERVSGFVCLSCESGERKPSLIRGFVHMPRSVAYEQWPIGDDNDANTQAMREAARWLDQTVRAFLA